MKTKQRRGEKSQAVREYVGQNPNATAPEVVAALEKQGTKVTQALVYGIRSGSKKSGKKSGRKRAAAASNGSAERGGKSQIIRQGLGQLGQDASAKDIVSYAASKGVVVSPVLVAKVKARMRTTRTESSQRPASAGSELSVKQLLATKELVDQMGGTRSLRRALEVLEKLR